MSAEKTIAFPDASKPSKKQSCAPGLVSCSVCLEVVTDAGERSIAKLKCGHHFHLDCIGSAFNAKGRMQCPNCRQVEHGQWLYASSCILHEDFVDDLTYEDDAEVYGGAANLQFGHIPWCPHQGSYAHFSLAFEEIDSTGNSYLNPVVNMQQGSRTAAAAHICPYLAVHGFSMGGPLHRVEDFLALQIGHHFSRNTRRATSFPSGHSSHWHQQGAAYSASNSMPAYDGYFQNYNSSGGSLQQSSNRHHTAGFSFGNPSSVHAGAGQGPNPGGNSGHFSYQPSQSHSAQGMHSNNHNHLHNVSRNGYTGSRQPRYNPTASVPSQRTFQDSSSERVQMSEQAHEYGSWGARLGQSPNQLIGDGMGWATGSQPEFWTRGMYASEAQFGNSSHWWAWVPPGNGQRSMSNVPNPYLYHDGRFFGTGLSPTPTVPLEGFSEHVTEGAYMWRSPGFFGG